jgi:hypothetical protein
VEKSWRADCITFVQPLRGALCLRSRRRVLLPLLIIICTVNVCVHICKSCFLSLAPSVCVCVHKHMAAVEAWLASSLWLWTITQLQSVIMWAHGCCFVIIFAEHSLCCCRLIMIIVLCTADPYLSFVGAALLFYLTLTGPKRKFSTCFEPEFALWRAHNLINPAAQINSDIGTN